MERVTPSLGGPAGGQGLTDASAGNHPSQTTAQDGLQISNLSFLKGQRLIRLARSPSCCMVSVVGSDQEPEVGLITRDCDHSYALPLVGSVTDPCALLLSVPPSASVTLTHTHSEVVTIKLWATQGPTHQGGPSSTQQGPLLWGKASGEVASEAPADPQEEEPGPVSRAMTPTL